MQTNQACMLTRVWTLLAGAAGASVVVFCEWKGSVVGWRAEQKSKWPAGDERIDRVGAAGGWRAFTRHARELCATGAWPSQPLSKARRSTSLLAARQTQCETQQHHSHLFFMHITSCFVN